MEELTKTEQIKLGNFKEHLAALKREVAQVNDELSRLVAARDKEREVFHKEKTLNDKELSILKKELAAVKQETETELRKIENERTVLAADKKAFTDYSEKELEHIQKLRDAAQRDIEHKEEKIQEAKERFALLDHEIKLMGKDAEELSETIADLEVILSRNQNLVREKEIELASLSEQYEEKNAQLAKETIRLEKEIAKLENEALVAGEKIKVGILSLQSEEASAERKRKQLQILYNRTKKAFEQLYPGQNLDNLIKL
jgi:chromosome segregation ATPase